MHKQSFVMSALCALVMATSALAQTGVPSADRIIRFNGSVSGASAGAQTLRFAVYDEETGGNLLWEEVQTAAVDAAGNYSVFLGGTSADGLPVALFANGAPRWLSVERAGTAPGPRVLLAAVPYAVSAANATSLGGRPAADYLLTPRARAAAAASTDGAATADRDPQLLVNNGTANFIGKFFNNVDLINSSLYDAGGTVGLNTTTPLDIFHSRFTNAGGTQTGLAVQNLSGAANAYSGMLFYDHTGALRQFQGYNNSNGEYRINNISSTGSINFLIGSDSKFKVATSGFVSLGGGTNNASTRLQLFGSSPNDVTVLGSRHEGTISAPTAINFGANLVRLEGGGYNGSAFTTEKGYLQVVSTEAWTTTANGTEINFGTTANGTTTVTERMTIANNGNVGIGSSSPGYRLDVNGDVRTRAEYRVGGTSLNGLKWVDAGGFLQADMFRFGSVDNRLYVSNNGGGNLTGVYLASGATSWTSTSDERLKRNITPITGLLDKIKGIRVASYDMANMSAGASGAVADFTKTHHEVGSIAQDWVKSFPELVVKPNTDTEYYGLNYERIGVVAIGAVQELNAVVEQKDAEIKSLTERIAALEAALKSLTTTVQQQR